MCGSRIWRGLEASQRLGGGTWGMVRKDMRSRSQPKSRVRYRNGGSGGRGAATELAAVGDKRPVVVRSRPRSGPLGPRSFDLSIPCKHFHSANLGEQNASGTLLIALVASLRGNFSAQSSAETRVQKEIEAGRLRARLAETEPYEAQVRERDGLLPEASARAASASEAHRLCLQAAAKEAAKTKAATDSEFRSVRFLNHAYGQLARDQR